MSKMRKEMLIRCLFLYFSVLALEKRCSFLWSNAKIKPQNSVSLCWLMEQNELPTNSKAVDSHRNSAKIVEMWV